jgi:hypothetical protein
MSEPVVSQAKSWGFKCELTAGGNWQISSPQLKETWQLSELEERWLLSVGNVPQINLSADEALRFLERRHRLDRAQPPSSQ